MHKDPSIVLTEVFDCLCFWVQFDSSSHGRSKLSVRKFDSCNLRVKRASNQSSQKSHILGLFIQYLVTGRVLVVVIHRNNTCVLQGADELRLRGGNVAQSLLG